MNNYIVREAFIDGVAKRYCAPCKEHGCDLDGDWCPNCGAKMEGGADG